MLEITQAAQKEVAAYFKDKDPKPVRIFLGQGCGGRQFGMALDEKRDDDEAYEFAGITYLVEKPLMREARPIKVDFGGHGFRITSSIELGGGCGGCGSSGGCGSDEGSCCS